MFQPASIDLSGCLTRQSRVSLQAQRHAFLVRSYGPLPSFGMVHDRLRISSFLCLSCYPSIVRVVYLVVAQIPQLWYPLPDVITLRVLLLTLPQRIEDTEVGLRIHTHTGAES